MELAPGDELHLDGHLMGVIHDGVPVFANQEDLVPAYDMGGWDLTHVRGQLSSLDERGYLTLLEPRQDILFELHLVELGSCVVADIVSKDPE